MSEKEKKDDSFRVIDKRGTKTESAPKTESTAAKGDGFTMKDSTASTKSPTVDFSTFIFSLASSTYISLGLAPDPSTKKSLKNIEFARQNIEVLSMIKDKTKGNLEKDEVELLNHLLTDVQLRFVEESKKP